VPEADNLTTCDDCLEIWVPQLPGTLKVCPDLYWDCFNIDIKSTLKYIYRVYQNDWSGLEVDYIHRYGEQNYKFQ
jgi:hypothetical protein